MGAVDVVHEGILPTMAKREYINHDRLFKELIGSYFFEFIELFLPDVAAYIDRDFQFVPMEQELFTDVTHGEKHVVDLLMKVKFRGEDAFFLVHVENESKSKPDFPRRMFQYFCRLQEKYALPVYPVVIYSHNSPLRAEPNFYEISFSDRNVLRFEYAVIQLNQYSWRDFVNRENPIASALMAKMRMTEAERPKVKLECFRLLSKLKLDPARSTLIGGFVDSYLKLNAEDMKEYERELNELAPAEKEATVELISSWEQQGIEKGIAQGIAQGLSQGIGRGKEELVLRLIQRQLGHEAISGAVIDRLDRLSPNQLDDLGVALLDFDSVVDLEAWLSRPV